MDPFYIAIYFGWEYRIYLQGDVVVDVEGGHGEDHRRSLIEVQRLVVQGAAPLVQHVQAHHDAALRSARYQLES